MRWYSNFCRNYETTFWTSLEGLVESDTRERERIISKHLKFNQTEGSVREVVIGLKMKMSQQDVVIRCTRVRSMLHERDDW